MVIFLTYEDRKNFPYLMPTQGNLKALELADSILNKIRFEEITKGREIQDGEVEFTKEEIEFLIEILDFLEEQRKLPFVAFSLIKKILKAKELD